MKFGKLFQRQILPEWEDEYLNYKKLNTLIKRGALAFYQAHLERCDQPIRHNPDAAPVAYPLGSLTAPKLPKEDGESDDDEEGDDDAEWAFSFGWSNPKEEETSKRKKRPTTPGGMGGYGSLDAETSPFLPLDKSNRKKDKKGGKKNKIKGGDQNLRVGEDTPLVFGDFQAISMPDNTNDDEDDDEEDSIMNTSGDSLNSGTTSVSWTSYQSSSRAGADATSSDGDKKKKKKDKKNKQNGADDKSPLPALPAPSALALQLDPHAPLVGADGAKQDGKAGKKKKNGKKSKEDPVYAEDNAETPSSLYMSSDTSDLQKSPMFPDLPDPSSLEISGKTAFPNSAPPPTHPPTVQPLIPSALPPLPPHTAATHTAEAPLANPRSGSSDGSNSNAAEAPPQTAFARMRSALSFTSLSGLLTPAPGPAAAVSPVSPVKDPAPYEQFQEQFWTMLRENVVRINTHYHKVLTRIQVELQKHLLPLTASSSAVQHRHTQECQRDSANWRCGSLHDKTSLPPDSAAYSEILLCYAEICQLMKYAKTNANALDKILNKYLKFQPRVTLADKPRFPVNLDLVQKFRKTVEKQDWMGARGVHEARTRVYQSGMLSRTDIAAIETASPQAASNKDALCANVKTFWVLVAVSVFTLVLALPLDLVSHRHRAALAPTALAASPALLQYLQHDPADMTGVTTDGQHSASTDALGVAPSTVTFDANQSISDSHHNTYAELPTTTAPAPAPLMTATAASVAPAAPAPVSTASRMPPVFPADTPESVLLFYNWQAQKCFAVLLLALILWCTEAFPYFATALMLPPLIIMLSLVPDANGVPLPARKAADVIASKMFSQTTFLLLLGFTLAAVACTAQLEKRIAEFIHKKLGNRPRLFILALMILAWVLSAWLNNHTAPVLVTSIVAPILKELPQGDAFTKCTVLAVAIASNFGGMASPLASLQNIIAVQSLQAYSPVSFPEWLLVCGSISLVLVVIAWVIITASVDWEKIEPLPALIMHHRAFSPRRRVAVICSVLAIILLATAGLTEPYIGGITTIALVFMGFVFSTNVLPASQVHAFPWPLILLVASASSLSLAIQASKLLSLLASAALSMLSDSPLLLAAQLLFMVTLLASGVSHTVAALVLLPLLAPIANDLGMPVRLVVCSALCINAAMPLPFSSFPNLHALALRDDSGHPLINAKDVIRAGTIMTVISFVLIVSVAYPVVGYFLGQ